MKKPDTVTIDMRDKGMCVYEKHMRAMAYDYANLYDWDEMEKLVDVFSDSGIRSTLMYRYARERVKRVERAIRP